MNPNDLQWRERDKLVITSCFEVVVASAAPLAVVAPSLARFYEAFMERFVSGLTYYATGTMRFWRKPNEKVLRMVPALLFVTVDSTGAISAAATRTSTGSGRSSVKRSTTATTTARTRSLGIHLRM